MIIRGFFSKSVFFDKNSKNSHDPSLRPSRDFQWSWRSLLVTRRLPLLAPEIPAPEGGFRASPWRPHPRSIEPGCVLEGTQSLVVVLLKPLVPRITLLTSAWQLFSTWKACPPQLRHARRSARPTFLTHAHTGSRHSHHGQLDFGCFRRAWCQQAVPSASDSEAFRDSSR